MNELYQKCPFCGDIGKVHKDWSEEVILNSGINTLARLIHDLWDRKRLKNVPLLSLKILLNQINKRSGLSISLSVLQSLMEKEIEERMEEAKACLKSTE